MHAPDTGWSWEYFIVTLRRSGLVLRTHSFPIDQRAEALRCYEALGNPEDDTGLVNGASRLGEEFLDALLDRDRGRMTELLTVDAVYDNRRPWHSAVGVGERRGAEIVESGLSLVEEDGLRSVDRETIAVRGDELALSRSVYRFAADDTDSYLVLESSCDRLARMTRFGTDHLHDALDLLDRRWAELDGSPVVREYVDAVSRLRHGFAAADLAALASLLDPSFVAVDHRSLGLGERTKDEWLASNATLVGAAGVDWIVRTVERDGDAFLIDVVMEPRSGEEWRWEYLIVTGVRSGRFVRAETFADTDRDAARRRMAELSR
jgi:hypothetical protein